MLNIFAHTNLADTAVNNKTLGYMMDGQHTTNIGSYDFVWMMLLALFIVLLVVAVYSYTVKSEGGNVSTPLYEAKLRYAKGEISKKEFEHIKKDIK